ncbi:MAG TPA: thioredoxin domain-containing protein [archaeon]|nr:thioredoxin domain-containing protein [archaeon]
MKMKILFAAMLMIFVAGTVFALSPPTVAENVLCIFNNSKENEAHKCYSDYALCSGVGSCQALINPINQTKIEWKSSCDGAQYTIADGTDKKIEFDCSKSGSEIGAEYFVSEDDYGYTLYVKPITSTSEKVYITAGFEWNNGDIAGISSKSNDPTNKFYTTLPYIKELGAYEIVTLAKRTYLNINIFVIIKENDVSKEWKVPLEQVKIVEAPSNPESGSTVGSTLLIEIFDDLEGPFGALFNRNTLPIIEKEFSGKVEFVYRHFPLEFHTHSQKAAEAAECARDQVAFRKYIDTVFANQQNLENSDLENYAAQLGLDKTKFNECLESSSKAAKVKLDYEDGISRKVNGTPTVFIGKRVVVGAQGYEVFKQAIEAELGIVGSTGEKEPIKKVTESVKCLFNNSEAEQKCYSEVGFCGGIEACTVEVTGDSGKQIVWKSSCGGYAYTTMDGSNEYAKFDCSKTTSGGSDDKKEPIPSEGQTTIPVPALVCTEDDTKSFECADGGKVSWCTCIGGNWKCAQAPEKQCKQQEQTPLCTGCTVDNQCIPIGTRLSVKSETNYCDITKKVELQKNDGSTCQNSFECVSNNCSSGVCLNLQQQLSEQRNLLEQIIDWLSSIFGFKPK